ncbi:histidine phosphatase superfamily clade-2 protein [Rutstroemia sp. NJR-2017a BVV2]|nr:histidine phosphatase superfamily clade-2 protein [Rutstroemia sp. NJR-2017a BVV2]
MRGTLFTLASALLAVNTAAGEKLLTDISRIQKYWGEITPYSDNAEDYFGVEYVGLPDGCQVESVQVLQRHAQRFQTTAEDDGENDQRFAEKLSNFTSTSTNGSFTGPLSFLNRYTYLMKDTGLLTGLGASTEFSAGLSFWNRYGRTLYNASVGQLAYDPYYPNGTARPKPVLRTTSQSRIQNSQINWALGFFGPSYLTVPDPTFSNVTSAFDVVIIPEGGNENNTLASYDSCFNDYVEGIYDIGDSDVYTYLPKYLGNATARLQKYAPAGFELNYNDTYAMQSICAYENAYIGMSDFCGLFTEDEWAGFENTLDMIYWYDYAYGNPTGRAQGLGYVQEVLARLQHQYISASNSSVNSTLDNNPTTFPLDQKFYADFSHDDIIVSALTAMSMDYFRSAPSLTQYPPDPNRNFILSHITPFGARLMTETIGCAAADPKPVKNARVQYSPGQYGYDAANATHKFVRMRLNNGILPLESIRGGFCKGRKDGMCEIGKFLESQKNVTELANYDYVCFGNYTIANVTSGRDFDGTLFA